jgi:hypothetical protein
MKLSDLSTCTVHATLPLGRGAAQVKRIIREGFEEVLSTLTVDQQPAEGPDAAEAAEVAAAAAAAAVAPAVPPPLPLAHGGHMP